MPWSKPFEATDPETGEPTTVKTKSDDEGYVTDMIHGIEQDQAGGKHGHDWELDSEIPDNPEDDPIGGRDPVDSSGNSIYGSDNDADAEDAGDNDTGGDSEGDSGGDAGE